MLGMPKNYTAWITIPSRKCIFYSIDAIQCSECHQCHIEWRRGFLEITNLYKERKVPHLLLLIHGDNRAVRGDPEWAVWSVQNLCLRPISTVSEAWWKVLAHHQHLVSVQDIESWNYQCAINKALSLDQFSRRLPVVVLKAAVTTSAML
jgi:hypothetical protein